MTACVNETVSRSRPLISSDNRKEFFSSPMWCEMEISKPARDTRGAEAGRTPPCLLGGDASIRTQVLMTNTCRRSATQLQLSALPLKLQQFLVWDEKMMTDRRQLLHTCVSISACTTQENLDKSNLTFWQEPFFLLEYNQAILSPPLPWLA